MNLVFIFCLRIIVFCFGIDIEFSITNLLLCIFTSFEGSMFDMLIQWKIFLKIFLLHGLNFTHSLGSQQAFYM